jgi:mRNA-degrading endonuclease RelE of RelBE toxin-antitoxin system
VSDDGPYVVQYDPRAMKELAKLKDAELVVLALRVAHRSDVYRNL